MAPAQAYVRPSDSTAFAAMHAKKDSVGQAVCVVVGVGRDDVRAAGKRRAGHPVSNHRTRTG